MFSGKNFAMGQLLAYSHAWSHVNTQESASILSCFPEGGDAKAVDIRVTQAWVWVPKKGLGHLSHQGFHVTPRDELLP